jgi:isoaspartyl peptidase/L-asparaginase-like protein (Ntn-hydrolase superfamily)
MGKKRSCSTKRKEPEAACGGNRPADAARDIMRRVPLALAVEAEAEAPLREDARLASIMERRRQREAAATATEEEKETEKEEKKEREREEEERGGTASCVIL